MSDTSPTAEAEPSRSAVAIAQARERWTNLAGRTGLVFALVGFFVIALAWNGSAGLDYAQGQLPYLISGGVGGLGLIIMGAAVLITDGARRDRAALEAKLDALINAIEAPESAESAKLSAMPAPRGKTRKTA